MKIRNGNTILYANYQFGAGDETGHHAHHEDGHTTFCFAGSIRLERWMNGLDEEKEVIELPAGGFAYIEKNIIHNVIALQDDSAYACIWSLRVDENGAELPGQKVESDLARIDVWEKESEAPWLKS